ncbi:MAG: glucose-1-phosphate cytidylyltransferase [Planctomycetaceae bacterium]|nr:glucose-1-phosphate cytidylyltransferase [Planctomycetaceae bacterium]
MQVVLLAGGLGTRISEETAARPKPMIEIGGIPILVHIMRLYSHYGHNEFVVCAGYKSQVIKDFFRNFYMYMVDTTFDMENNEVISHGESVDMPPWRVTVVDTGLETMTGGRLRRIRSYLRDEPFFMTYGDGLADVDMHALLETHQKSNCLATVTAVQPPARYGRFSIADGRITGFIEKPADESDWINGGFFVIHPSALDRITDDDEPWERMPMESLAAEGKLAPYFHRGFWQPMDTLRDKRQLEAMWEKGNAPWKIV